LPKFKEETRFLTPTVSLNLDYHFSCAKPTFEKAGFYRGVAGWAA